MTSENDKSSKHHPPVDPEADALLQRAYSLKGDDEAHALYSEWADTYDRTMMDGLGYVTPLLTARLLTDYLPTTTCNILDVGAGTGLAGVELNKLGDHTIDALDYSADMLRVAGARGVYRNLIEADLNQPLDLPDTTYDALICTGTFTHAHVGANCLPELFRILKPGGHFACTVHNDIWVPQGFAEMTARLVETGILQTLHTKQGKYYAQSEEPEGRFIVWQKC